MEYTKENNGKIDKSLIQESEQPNHIENNKKNDVVNNKICKEPKAVDDMNETKYDNQRKEFVVVNLEEKLNDVNKAHELKEKCNAFEVIGRGRKTSTTWVQFNQLYGKSSPHLGGFGRERYAGAAYGTGTPIDPDSRNSFVKFVFMILLIMLALTAGYGVLVLTTPELKQFYKEAGLFLLLISLGVLIAMNYVMVCSACARVPPCNFISLVIVLVAMSNLVAAVTVRYKTQIVVMAVVATGITVALCVLLACTRIDFTKWYIYVIIVAMAFSAIAMVCSISMLVLGIKIKILQLILLFVGTLIQVVILIIELQMILGGRSIEIEENDYALAAYMLYTSIVEIFLHIIQIMGMLDK